MENFFNPVLTTQIIFLAVALISILISWYRSIYEASIVISFFLLASIYGWYGFAEQLHFLSEKFFLIQKLLRSIGEVQPELIMTWQRLAEWSSLAFGALVAWAVLIISMMLDEKSQIIRGTKVLTQGEILKLLKKKGKPHVPIYIGNYFLPTELETRSTILFGEPGSGKTQIILNMLSSIVERPDRVIALDAGGDLYKVIGKQSDLLLSPAHEGSHDWSPFAEINQGTDCNMIAEAFVPIGTGENKSWNMYARNLLVVILKKCFDTGKTTNRDLMYFVSIAMKDELEILAKGTIAQRLFEDGNEKMLGNVQSILAQYLSSFEILNLDADENSFSLRKWIADEDNKSWLWLAYDDVSAAATSSLRAAWIDILVREALNLSPNSDRRIWFVLDELASNGKIEILSQAISRGRKYGLSLLLGVQNVSQLYSLYGRDEATSILGSTGHSVILRTPDPETSEYLSRMIGQSEEENEQVSVNSPNNSTTTQTVIKTKPAVLPSEISALDDLRGFIKFAGIGWAEVKIPISKLKTRNILKPKLTDVHVMGPNFSDSRAAEPTTSLDDI